VTAKPNDESADKHTSAINSSLRGRLGSPILGQSPQEDFGVATASPARKCLYPPLRGSAIARMKNAADQPPAEWDGFSLM
jgi:hypothetical protein